MSTGSIFNTQHVATRRNRVAKRTQHAAQNNVAIVWQGLKVTKANNALWLVNSASTICPLWLLRFFRA